MIRYRKQWTDEEKRSMQSFYNEDTFINGKRLRDLANQVDATPRQVKVWFQNKRQRQDSYGMKWYETGCKKARRSNALMADMPTTVDNPAFGFHVSPNIIENTCDFGLPINLYFMLATIDEESVHQFTIRCLALSFSIYLLQPMHIYMTVADYILKTSPDPVKLVLTALQTIMKEFRVRFFFEMDEQVGNLYAFECVLMCLGFPMTLA